MNKIKVIFIPLTKYSQNEKICGILWITQHKLYFECKSDMTKVKIDLQDFSKFLEHCVTTSKLSKRVKNFQKVEIVEICKPLILMCFTIQKHKTCDKVVIQPLIIM